ncbi:MAG: hypothetical protein F4158_02265 [Synechococcus sp. SB0675_bin_7]|nr:hypothetical protein [Synechococcus sp. SB0675_bin_7]
MAGYGWGQLSLEPDGAATDDPNTNLRMAAIGMDGLLREGGAGGISLTTITDVLLLHTTSEEVQGLQSSEGSVFPAPPWSGVHTSLPLGAWVVPPPLPGDGHPPRCR